jgi:bacillithiol biosynthesis cysteine-adding enzyme BshC
VNLYGDNRLFTDHVHRFARVAPFHGRDPRLTSLVADLAEAAERPLEGEDLEALIRFNTLPFSDTASVRREVEALGEPTTLVVLTGQQAGLLLGPMYTVIKAVNALQLARRLSEATGRRAVAIFWIASEDHDFEEVNHFSWLDSEGKRRRFEMPLPAGHGGHSVGPMPTDRAIFRGLLDDLRASTQETGFRAEAVGLLDEAVAASSNVGDLFRHLLLRLFQSEGLVAVDPWFPPIKRHLPRILQREIEHPGEISGEVLAASERLRTAGYEPQVHRRQGDLNFFLDHDGIRARAVHAGDRFQAVHPTSGEVLSTHTPEELGRLLESDPDRFSPNVVTKPLIRDLVFRPVAYIGGPGEVSYHAQFRSLYEQAGVEMPAIRARSQVALLNPRTRRALKRLEVTAMQWLEMTADERTAALARHSASAESLQAFEESRLVLLRQMEALEKSVVEIDPGHRKSVERMLSSLAATLGRLSAQMARAARERDEQIATAANLIEETLTPGGLPQERVDTVFFPHTMHHGLALIPRLIALIDLEEPDLQVIEVA